MTTTVTPRCGKHRDETTGARQFGSVRSTLNRTNELHAHTKTALSARDKSRPGEWYWLDATTPTARAGPTRQSTATAAAYSYALYPSMSSTAPNMTHHTLEASSSFTRTRKRLSPTGKKYKKEGGAKWVPFFFREKKKSRPCLLFLSRGTGRSES
jgi:hypothetical protein